MSEVALELFVDDDPKPRDTFGAYFDTNHTWRHFVIGVPGAAHRYTFTARSNVDIAPAFVLDTFVCK